MTTADILKRTLMFIAFVLVQTLVLGHIHLFSCATPIFYVYFIIMTPRNYPKWALLLWAFFMGLAIDVFFNTPGLAAASLTLIAAVQPYFFELFVPRDSVDDLVPSLHTIGVQKYAYYTIGLVLLYCVVFFSLEMFTFFNVLHWLACVGGSALITLVLIFTFEIAGKK